VVLYFQSFIKVLKISTLFREDQDQDFFFKTNIKTKTFISRPRPRPCFHVLEVHRDQYQGLETTSLVLIASRSGEQHHQRNQDSDWLTAKCCAQDDDYSSVASP